MSAKGLDGKRGSGWKRKAKEEAAKAAATSAATSLPDRDRDEIDGHC